MLLRFKLFQFENITFLNVREQDIIVALAASRWQYFKVTVEADDASFRAKLIVTRVDRNGSAGEFGIVGLAGDKAAPDQVVQTLGVRLHGGQVTGTQADIRRADGFVRFLCAFFAAVLARIIRQVLRAQFVVDVVANAGHGILAEVR